MVPDCYRALALETPSMNLNHLRTENFTSK